MLPSPLRRQALLAAALLAAGTAPLAAQHSSRPGESEFRWSGPVTSGDHFRVNNISGDVSVTATDGDRVELVATLHGDGPDSEVRVEVKEHAGGVTICTLYGDDAYCDADGARQERQLGWGRSRRGHYDLEVRVPRRMRITAGSVSGDIRVNGAKSPLRATSVSGDVTLERIRAAGALEATSVSGDVQARMEAVDAATDMELKSVSGDVSVSMPRTTGFDLDMSTVSGDLVSDFALQMQGRFNRRHVRARANDGGADIRVSTVSGDVRLANN